MLVFVTFRLLNTIDTMIMISFRNTFEIYKRSEAINRREAKNRGNRNKVLEKM